MLNRINFLFSLATICFTGQSIVHSDIVESDRIEMVEQFVEPNAMVFVNISDVIYQPMAMFTEHRWRKYFTARVEQVLGNSIRGQELIKRVKKEIVEKVPKKLIEENTPFIISKLQNDRIPVLGITTKKMATPYADNFGEITRDHLNSLGINLESTLSYFDNVSEITHENYDFAYGMIFSKASEAESLASFIADSGYAPSKVIVVEDSLQALEKMQSKFNDKGISFVGIRYNVSDERKSNFNPTLGIIQFLAFMQEKRIMLNEEAEQLLKQNPDVNYEALLDDYIIQAARSNS